MEGPRVSNGLAEWAPRAVDPDHVNRHESPRRVLPLTRPRLTSLVRRRGGAPAKTIGRPVRRFSSSGYVVLVLIAAGTRGLDPWRTDPFGI